MRRQPGVVLQVLATRLAGRGICLHRRLGSGQRRTRDQGRIVTCCCTRRSRTTPHPDAEEFYRRWSPSSAWSRSSQPLSAVTSGLPA